MTYTPEERACSWELLQTVGIEGVSFRDSEFTIYAASDDPNLFDTIFDTCKQYGFSATILVTGPIVAQEDTPA